MAYIGKVDAVPTLAEQFVKGISGGMGQGLSASPDFISNLIKEKRQRKNQFGEAAVDLARKYDPELGPEDSADIYSEGASLLKGSMTDDEAQRALTKQAVKRKNEQSRMEENIDPDRGIWSTLKHAFTGETSEDRDTKSKKLTKQLESSRLSNTKKREILSKKLAPEEVEERLNPLSKEDISSIDSFPQMRPGVFKSGKRGGETLANIPNLKDNEKQFFKSHLAEVLNKNPKANPLLLRKKFEDKGVNWRDFRDAIDQLQEEGVVDFSNDQDYAQLEKHLNKPPLSPLYEFLHDIRLVGR